jgi:8-oxo-dGTP pyrophosphatase MutT (NUDIX family)
MKKSCGIIVLFENKIMLCHPTNSKWEGTYGIPKGGIDTGESELDCAVREFFEETGIKIKKERLEPGIILPYKDKKTGTLYKEVHLFTHRIEYLAEIGLDIEIVPQSQLQIEEIDWCGFLTKEESVSKIFHRQVPVLDFIK